MVRYVRLGRRVLQAGGGEEENLVKHRYQVSQRCRVRWKIVGPVAETRC